MSIRNTGPTAREDMSLPGLSTARRPRSDPETTLKRINLRGGRSSMSSLHPPWVHQLLRAYWSLSGHHLSTGAQVGQDPSNIETWMPLLSVFGTPACVGPFRLGSGRQAGHQHHAVRRTRPVGRGGGVGRCPGSASRRRLRRTGRHTAGGAGRAAPTCSGLCPPYG